MAGRFPFMRVIEAIWPGGSATNEGLQARQFLIGLVVLFALPGLFPFLRRDASSQTLKSEDQIARERQLWKRNWPQILLAAAYPLIGAGSFFIWNAILLSPG